MVLEVGLGGALDATNVVRTALSVVGTWGMPVARVSEQGSCANPFIPPLLSSPLLSSLPRR